MGRDYYLPRPPQWQPERLGGQNEHSFDGSAPATSANPNMARYHHHEQSSDMSRPMSIEKALREQCRIPAQFYFVSAILDNGETVTFSGPTEYKEQIPDFFNINRWVRCATGEPSTDLLDDADATYEDHYSHLRSRSRPMQNQGPGQLGSQGMGHNATLEYEGRRGYDRRRAHNMDEPDEDAFRNRKRVKAAGSRRAVDIPEDRSARAVQPSKLPIRINEAERIWHIYDLRFRGLQQTACKLIAKAWVKLVEPKKQSTHPYTGSDEKAPDWWPKPWGSTRDEKVRHKEPDHLYKKERVHLLKHILRMIVVPNAEQHPDIQKLNLNVAKLEEATNEVLSSFFVDKDAPNNAKKRPYLKEIFTLAKAEERFRNGEIDGTAYVYVMSEDKIPDNYQSETEEASPAKGDEENALRMSTTISPRRAHEQPLIAPARPSATTMPSSAPVSSHSSNHSPSGDIQHGANQQFISDLPHRNHPTYPPAPLMHPEIGSEHQTGYVDNGGMNVGSGSNLAEGHGGVALQQMVSSQHESSRRSSIFSPTAEFNSAPAPGNVYQTWQQGSNAPSASPMYAFPPTAPQPAPPQHSSFVPQNSVAMPAQSHSYMGYDPLPRNTYDSPHDNMFRHGAVPPPGTVNPQGGYSIQLPQHDGRGLPSHGLKVEPNSQRTHLH